MPHENAPFLTRRARLLMGMTQAEFAEMFEVEDATVSRWERGKLHPSAKVWPRIREIALRSAIPLSDEMVREAHVYKFIVPMNDLTHPAVVSKGAVEALARAGIKRTDLTAAWWSTLAPRGRLSPPLWRATRHSSSMSCSAMQRGSDRRGQPSSRQARTDRPPWPDGTIPGGCRSWTTPPLA